MSGTILGTATHSKLNLIITYIKLIAVYNKLS